MNSIPQSVLGLIVKFVCFFSGTFLILSKCCLTSLSQHSNQHPVHFYFSLIKYISAIRDQSSVKIKRRTGMLSISIEREIQRKWLNPMAHYVGDVLEAFLIKCSAKQNYVNGSSLVKRNKLYSFSLPKNQRGESWICLIISQRNAAWTVIAEHLTHYSWGHFQSEAFTKDRTNSALQNRPSSLIWLYSALSSSFN